MTQMVKQAGHKKYSNDESGDNRARLEELVKERTFELIEANENLQVEIKVRKQAEKQLLTYQKQLRLLSSQISLIEEREKRRIASELHDCIGQTLALTKIKLKSLTKLSGFAESKNIIEEIIQLVDQTIRGARTLTFELSPPILYELGFCHAVQWLVDQFNEQHDIEIILGKYDGDIYLDNSVRFILFQALRELLINIVKHSQATKVSINMSVVERNLKIVVEDNGIGFPESSNTYSGYGLFNIRERMNHINGHFEIIPRAHNRGTRATIMTSLKHSETNQQKRGPL
jgi:signal transduction histidine kinase